MAEVRVAHALTFDVEEWFQAEVFAPIFPPERWGVMESRCEEETDLILRLLAEKGARATFFVLGWIAERHEGLVKRIAGEGHELACHGYDHTMITRQDRKRFGGDVSRAKCILERAGGCPVRGYRAPTFSVTEGTRWALDVLWENGFLYDASIYPIRHDRYGIPGAPRFPHVAVEKEGRRLWEFPGPTLRLLGMTIPAAGGGYLRLFPYFWTRAALRAATRRGLPMTVFAHPWEFDRGLPDAPLSRVSHLRHYGGIRGNCRKLARMIGEFDFAPMGEVVDRLEREEGGGTLIPGHRS